MLSQEVFTTPEIASEAIKFLWQKQSYSMAHRVLYPIFGWPYIHLLIKPANIQFLREKVLQGDRWWNSMQENILEGRASSFIVSGDSLKENWWTLECLKCLHVSFHWHDTYLCIEHSPAGPSWANTVPKLIWTVVIFNGYEASEPLANGRTLKMYS